MNNKNKGKDEIPSITRRELAIAVILGCVNFALFAILDYFTGILTAVLAIALCTFYLLEIALLGYTREKRAQYIPSATLESFLSENSSIVFKNSRAPILMIDKYGIVLWYNEAMREILDAVGSYIGAGIDELFGEELDYKKLTSEPQKLFGRLYNVEGFVINSEGDGLYLAKLTDITDLSLVEKKYNDERTAVAYIAIDNIEDVLQYVHEKFMDAVSAVDDKIKAWVASMNGVIKSYENDKYVAFFDSASLEECKANRFQILDEIRATRLGDGVSITASIGISNIEGTLAERENYAKSAIDLALQRGGDQVVYKTHESVEYYGGRTKSIYKRSNVKSRTFTNQLLAMMVRADNVIVMGHKYGDFDSFGASVGIIRLATLCGAKANIAVDVRDKNLAPCIALMQNNDEYDHIFVDNAEAIDLVGPDTLVVLVDHNEFSRSQFSEIAGRVNSVVIIDHHRKSEAEPDTVKLSYIEPSVSSTCELVSEMLENAVSSSYLLKEEADFILAGILLDTKQFTRNTGTRTFGAAQYLRGAGANPTDVYDLFKTDPEDLSKEARFHTGITIYKGNIAISSCDGDTDESYRVIASKAADKMLTLKGIDASFTLVRIGEQIHVSARSTGKINVQLILEKIGGGGHFDIAGAQVVSESIISVLEELKSNIDDYLDDISE